MTCHPSQTRAFWLTVLIHTWWLCLQRPAAISGSRAVRGSVGDNISSQLLMECLNIFHFKYFQLRDLCLTWEPLIAEAQSMAAQLVYGHLTTQSEAALRRSIRPLRHLRRQDDETSTFLTEIRYSHGC